MKIRDLARRLLAHAAAAGRDFFHFIIGRSERDLPPGRLRDGSGAGDFRKVGEELVSILVDRGAVRPNERLLDIGCGAGRVALPLTRYLAPEGAYDGFDVSVHAIRWCRSHISSRHPNFRFRRVAVRSSEYSWFGVRASEFTFPHGDASFDCAFAFSLFTHLTFAELRQYLRESARVLAHDGRLVSTFFLLTPESEARLPALPLPFSFPVVDEPCRFGSRTNPAAAVAIRESALLELLRDAGLREPRITYGQWSGDESAPTFQDLVVCAK